MFKINPYKTQEMYSGGSGYSSYGAGQQAGVHATGEAQGTSSIKTGANSYEKLGLVDRLNKIDAGTVKPNTSGASSVDGYDSELSVNGLAGVTGESIFIGKSSGVDSGNNFGSLVARLNNMDYEMHPDTRDAFRGNRLYLEG